MLLTRPFPDLNETLQSYVIRLARANHYSIEQWAQYLSQECAPVRTKDLNSRKQLVSFLSRVTGMTEIEKLFDQWQFFNTDKNHFDYKMINICPVCFSENNGKINASWVLRYNLCCEKHSCLLVDICSGCGHAISEKCVLSKQCQQCGLQLSKIVADRVSSDYFSSRMHQKIAEGIFTDRDSLLNELAWQSSNIEAFSPLVYKENQPNWRKKRDYSVWEKHEHQVSISELMKNENMLNTALVDHVQEQFDSGITDLGKALLRFNKYLFDEVNPQILHAVKRLIFEQDFSAYISVGPLWLSKVYGLDHNSLKQYLLEHASTTGFKNKSMPAYLAKNVISDYLKFK